MHTINLVELSAEQVDGGAILRPDTAPVFTGTARELNLVCGRCGVLLGEALRDDFDLAETVECPSCGALNRLPD